MATQVASSSSSYTSKWSYDVFLSFRGEDTRNNFTSHLYCALHQKGVHTFIDDNLKRGEELSQSFLDAIKESKISLVIFSKNYADSSWCLDELVQIIGCKETKGKMVRPIFYDVDPSEVRHQKSCYAEAFAKHEQVGRYNIERIQRWRTALNKAANLSGWHLGDGSQSRFIERIVEEVWSKLNRVYLDVAKHAVGIEPRVKDVKFMLDTGLSNVHIVGIHGIGGIGKTTIAKALYNITADQFEGCSFLANVRETSKQCQGLVELQETLLSEILGSKEIKIGNIYRGINLIKERLCYKRILIVLDDVDRLDQLTALAGERNWFGSGSRIIVTTRDEHLLVACGVDCIYRVKELDNSDSLQLLCWNAFKEHYPREGFEELSNNLINYTQGLPLALIVLGSFLCGRSKEEWESTLSKLKRFPHKEIYEVLKISFDGLEDHEKAIFLDIACFFKWEDIDYVRKVLDSCDFYPEIGIKVLVERALLTTENNRLWMHDLIEDMGKEIVRQESPEDPGQRSRLWFHEDILYVLTENAGTNRVEGMKLTLPEPEEVQLTSKSFKKMKRLRLLIIHNAQFSGDLEYLSNELRWLEWPRYPFSSLPANFSPKKLVAIDMPSSNLKLCHPVSAFKLFKCLKYMNLKACEFLTEVPDVSSSPNLEHLILEDCKSLIEVHESVGYLEKLLVLNLGSCSNLVSLPRSFKLKSLQSLSLHGCSRLEEFPEIIDYMECLERIRLEGTKIKELPSSIERITGLRQLYMHSCGNLTNLPSSIYKLQKLEMLQLGNCCKLSKFPKFTNNKRQLTSLNEGSSSTGSASSFNFFPSLNSLDLSNCKLSEVDFLTDTEHFPALSTLLLAGNNFATIPACMDNLAKLRNLSVGNCKLLQEIPELPANIEVIDAYGCESLQRYSQLPSMLRFKAGLQRIDFSDCHKLISNHGDQWANILLSEGFHGKPRLEILLPGSEIPEWFSYQSLESSISFQMPVNISKNVIALALCTVLGSKEEEREQISYEVQLFINGEIKSFFETRPNLYKSDNLWLYYFPQRLLSNSMGDYIDVKVSFVILDELESRTSCLKACGVHPIYGQSEEMSELGDIYKSDMIMALSEFLKDLAEVRR